MRATENKGLTTRRNRKDWCVQKASRAEALGRGRRDHDETMGNPALGGRKCLTLAPLQGLRVGNYIHVLVVFIYALRHASVFIQSSKLSRKLCFHPQGQVHFRHIIFGVKGIIQILRKSGLPIVEDMMV